MFDKDALMEAMELGGRFQVEHWRGDEKLATYDIHNEITTEGKDALLDIMFANDTQIETWYLSLVDVAGFTATAVTDTYDQIDGSNGWDEYTDYTYAANATARAEWQEDAASGGSISNTTVATFDIDAPGGSVYGIFLVGGGANADLQADAAGGGKLWATANFTANVVVANTDQLKVTYTVTA
jgi:hypothetical protein